MTADRTTTVLLTGAGGFAGSHCLEHILATTDWAVVATDSFRHKGRTDRISEVLDHGPSDWGGRVTVITHDLTAGFTPAQARRIGHIDHILAYASESHVDRSLDDPVTFIRNNVLVALSSLELARLLQPRTFVLVSTDEVYGPETDDTPHPEWDTILPSNPYSASKASQEAIATSYWRSYGVPVIIINCMNLIGERQAQEKFVPKVIRAVSRGEEVPIHGKAGNVGTRHYLHARNLADGILYILRTQPASMFPAHITIDAAAAAYRASLKKRPAMRAADRPDRYNIASPDRLDNLTLAHMIADLEGLPLTYRFEDFHSSRPGHDAHYGLNPDKILRLGWKPPVPFAESLSRTVAWTLAHPDWMLDD
jgi:dTDP-glucose 4,6-dehydratase